MKKFVIVVIGILIAASIIVVVTTSKTSQKTMSPVSYTTTPQPTSPSAKLLTYNDPSGFAFQYHEKLTVSKNEDKNRKLYSSLEISSPNGPEKIQIKAEDSDLNSIDEWFKDNKKTSVFGGITKAKLADLDAREFNANNEKNIIALDQGVLFTIATNAKKDSEIMKEYSTILKSFSFVQPTQSVESPSQNQSDDFSDSIVEEEEVIE